MQQAEREPANPVHMTTSDGVRWTTVNFAEAIQGVVTPLGWAMWDLSMETCTRIAFHKIGIFSKEEMAVPADPDLRVSGIFYGRAAGNVETFRSIGDRMPGSSGDILEEKLFGKEHVEDGGRKSLSAYRRYPRVALGMPRAMFTIPKQLPPMRAAHREWWQRRVLDAPPVTLEQARDLYRDAADHFIEVGILHTTTTLLASALLDALGDLADKATGDRALAMDLATGYGAMEEAELIQDIWAAAEGSLSYDEVIRRHGYHGPDEGELSSLSWREDGHPLESTIAAYQRGKVKDPRERAARQTGRRQAAEARVLGGLSPLGRRQAQLTMKLAATYIPMRETGKAAFLHALDAARCAARVGGEDLARRGIIADPGDVFFLTGEEFLAHPSGSMQDIVAERRERHARYEQLVLPPDWSGDPTPIPLSDAPPELLAAQDAALLNDAATATATASILELQGIGVAGDTVTGRARVVSDPYEVDLEPGDVLVCATTDPSWTPLFMVAEALVIDTGGQMSHGAIVARELGVTCVINTGHGTRDIPDGATVTVDGASGRVRVEPS
jgi:phosphohistidine swiveling domain-containing protein